MSSDYLDNLGPPEKKGFDDNSDGILDEFENYTEEMFYEFSEPVHSSVSLEFGYESDENWDDCIEF